MRVRAQLAVAAILVVVGAIGLVNAALQHAASGPHRHLVHRSELWWLLPVGIGVVWAQFLVVRYRYAVQRRLGQVVPVICTLVAGIGLALIGRSLVIGCGFVAGFLLLAVELLVLGGVLGAISPG